MTNPIRDAITGDIITTEKHNQWVLVGSNGRDEMWLTPTAARELAAQVLDAAGQVEAGCISSSTVGLDTAPSSEDGADQ